MAEQTLWSFYTQEAWQQLHNAHQHIQSASDWQQQRDLLYQQYMKSLGLHPLPERCDLDVQEHGTFGGQGYRAIRLSWQLVQNCRVTGHLYLPADTANEGPLPGVLYACGHQQIGVWGYQQHGIAWARRGYACLVYDTIEQHDNRGDHHGLYFGQQLDWISLGYSAAGGELFNSIRALDVLEQRPQVDADRLGATGISGGGAHSFYLGIADSRIKVVASVAGVSLHPYAIEQRYLQGHCDCMYAHNPYGRDISEFASLIAPRPALFAFARHDPLYTLDEFRGLVTRTRKIYDLLDCGAHCELFEYDGPHAYQPETLERIQQWFDQHLLGGEARALDTRMDRPHDEPEVSVFHGAPAGDARLLADALVPLGRVPLPQCREDWPGIQKQTLKRLGSEVLMRVHDQQAGQAGEPWSFRRVGQWLFDAGIKQKYVARSGGMEVMAMLVSATMQDRDVVITVGSEQDEVRGLNDRGRSHFGAVTLLAVEPRGTGFTSVHPAHAHHLQRAGALVGLTPTMLIVQDLWRLLPELYQLPELAGKRVFLHGKGDAGVACVYHALFDPRIAGVVLEEPPLSHRQGAYMLNVLRCLDLPEAIGLLAPRPVGVVTAQPHQANNTRGLMWPQRLYARLGCSGSFNSGRSLARVFDSVRQAADQAK